MQAPDSSQNASHKEHLKLAGVIKDVHAKLRKQFHERGDFEEVWREHTMDKLLLHEYADAMHHLAVDHWSKNPETRIDWCRKTCREFFLEGGLNRALEKDERRRKHEELSMSGSKDQKEDGNVSSNDAGNPDLAASMSPAGDGSTDEDSDGEGDEEKVWSPSNMETMESSAVIHSGQGDVSTADRAVNNDRMLSNCYRSAGETVDMTDPPEPESAEWEDTCEYIKKSKCRKLDTSCSVCAHSQLTEQNLCRFCLKLEKLRCGGMPSPGDGNNTAAELTDATLKQAQVSCPDDHRSQAVSDSVKVNISDWGSIEKDLPSITGATGDREHSFLNPNQIGTLPGPATPGLSVTPFSGSLSLEDNANLLSDSDEPLDDMEGVMMNTGADYPNLEDEASEGINPQQDDLTNTEVIEKFEKYSVSKYNIITLPFEGRMRLLDVGSCYNPFLEFKEFLAVGIDISPAVRSVYHCDFLHMELTEPLQLAADTINTYLHNLRDPVERLPRQCFHVIVFSLLLEYFPSSYQRWLCCQKAHDLLMLNGLLLIITPDSNYEQKNAPMMKSWKRALESMGFRRWRYTKQEHLHCMAFRKVADHSAVDPLVTGVSPDLLYIPQDRACGQKDREGSVMRETLPMSPEDEDIQGLPDGATTLYLITS